MKDTYLLVDTNIVSYAFKGDDRILLYAEILEGKKLAVSFMTAAELFQWIAVRNWGKKRIGQLETVLRDYVHLSSDMELCRLWGQVRVQCRAAGRPISPQDAWIGATGLRYELPLVTHDPDDFKAIEGLTVLSKKPETRE